MNPFRAAHNSSAQRAQAAPLLAEVSTSLSQNSVQKGHTEQLVGTSKFLAEASIPICPYLPRRTHVGVFGTEASKADQGE